MGAHELGTRREPRPAALATPAGSIARGERGDDIFREHSGGLAELQWFRSARQTTAGGHLYGHRSWLGRSAISMPRLQQRPGTHLDEVFKEPGPGSRLERLSGSQSALARSHQTLDYDRFASHRTPALLLRLQQS